MKCSGGVVAPLGAVEDFDAVEDVGTGVVAFGRYMPAVAPAFE